ncbi:MAG: hypothetical protein A3E78_08095 [Alphaproteobacteria bacterium RIFCSPHIGHO2_12_FULL_63_12]|nr:MAG: hypothetical protein A3E78_08095 [Alphaproteobacteria bacterium RIFCSPHIGHO2_12_FULL_63_12]
MRVIDAPSDANAPPDPLSRPALRSAAQTRAAAPAPSRHFVFGGGDPGLDRAAAARRIGIERTLDLHGMTQVQAHRALLQFIASAVHDGVRLVLVITGKGRAPTPEARGGVLRSRFLDWVEEPPLKGELARVSPAKPKDGGAGAFYVFLKRKSRGGPPRA